jgi:hypothetical protein
MDPERSSVKDVSGSSAWDSLGWWAYLTVVGGLWPDPVIDSYPPRDGHVTRPVSNGISNRARSRRRSSRPESGRGPGEEERAGSMTTGRDGTSRCKGTTRDE